MKIKQIIAREIIDSRGNPTVEADVILAEGTYGRAAVPSGASTGSLEAVELRDGDKKRFLGKGVLNAVENVNTKINKALKGKDATRQAEIDQIMIDLDGTKNKSKLGANAILAVSLATARAASHFQGIQLFEYISKSIGNRQSAIGNYTMPVPMMNIINGGAHADNPIDIQEFMIMPVGAKSCTDSIRMGAEVFHALKSALKKAGHSTNVGDEGGFAPNLKSAESVLEFIMKSIETAGYKPGKDVVLALDSASTEFYKKGKYEIDGKSLDSTQLVKYYEKLVNGFPIVSIEDAMAEDDHAGWKAITEALGAKIQLVGDDLFVTNPKILTQGIKDGLANAILVKVNQIGTLTETLEAVRIAQEAGYRAILSHRSGETEDTAIAHIAVATNCGQIKTGSLSRSDRLAKYNELIRIEGLLGGKSIYPGHSALKSYALRAKPKK